MSTILHKVMSCAPLRTGSRPTHATAVALALCAVGAGGCAVAGDEADDTLDAEDVGVATAAYWNGVPSSDLRVIGWEPPHAPAEFRHIPCSGVAISPVAFLTAAHCVPLPTHSCGRAGFHDLCAEADVTIRLPIGSKTYFPLRRHATMFRHHQYVDVNTPWVDIGLVVLDDTHFGAPVGIVNQEPVLGRHLFVPGGWGSIDEDVYVGGSQYRPFGDQLFGIDWVGSNGYFIDDNDTDVNTCNGDSGSPALAFFPGNLAGVQGLLSGSDKMSSSPVCRLNGASIDKVRWVSVNRHIPWIDKRLDDMGQPTCGGTTSLVFCN